MLWGLTTAEYSSTNISVNGACLAQRHDGLAKNILFMCVEMRLHPLTPNDPYRGRTAPLTSKRCILNVYSTNIGTEYFKHGIYCPFFFFKMQFVS